MLAWSSPARAQRLERDVPPARAQLEQQFRQRLALVMQRQLGLTDDQLKQVGDVSRKYEPERAALNARERSARVALRQEIAAGDRADQRRVDDLLQELFRVQRARLDVTEREQRDLARFLTPVQRVKFLTIQDRLRQQMESMQRQRERRNGAMRRNRPPGGGGPLLPEPAR
ncbi:MAG TPA: hypothetical protein VFK13_15265 [Gemmatimonadaceae bacterium]|nr:hypothetical protein [Gemmatimonadaceae bacterium]